MELCESLSELCFLCMWCADNNLPTVICQIKRHKTNEGTFLKATGESLIDSCLLFFSAFDQCHDFDIYTLPGGFYLHVSVFNNLVAVILVKRTRVTVVCE